MLENSYIICFFVENFIIYDVLTNDKRFYKVVFNIYMQQITC